MTRSLSGLTRRTELERPGVVIGLERGATMIAVACGGANFFRDRAGDPGPDAVDVLALNTPVARVGIRGMTMTGGRVEDDRIESYALGDYLADIDEAVSALGDVPPMFGYSLGGYFTTAYAVANPERLAALILVEPGLFTDPDDLRRRAEVALSGDPVAAFRSMIDRFDGGMDDARRGEQAEVSVQAWQSNIALGASDMVRAENPISEAQLAELSLPVLLIGGTASVARDSVKRAAAAIPECYVYWVRGADHFGVMYGDNADRVSAVTQDFLRHLAA